MQSIDLRGRKALIVGVANKESLAWWAARHIKDAGADIAMTYLNDKAKRYVAPLADELSAELLLPCDVAVPGQLDAVFDTIRNTWGKLDIVFHAIAWARKEDLHGRLTDCSAEGFSEAMLISVHSFIRMARLAEPLMGAGGSLITLSYYGAEKVVDHYNVMGPVKAALEASVRYLAHELGPKGIRINAISAGPISTRAASGIQHFDELLAEAAAKAPLRRTVEACEVGRVSVLLASDFGASITGEVIHADAGFHVAGMIFH
jgi:enoyl-[acyl-carrier protein] reductase I